MGVDGIDKADIFDEYFDDDKPKLTNFEKYKQALEEIDEMFKECSYNANYLNNCSKKCKFYNDCNGELSVIERKLYEVLNER